MGKKVFEVREYVPCGDGDYTVHAHVELDEILLDANGKFPTILVLPSGIVAYRYLDHYNVETGYYVSIMDLTEPVRNATEHGADFEGYTRTPTQVQDDQDLEDFHNYLEGREDK